MKIVITKTELEVFGTEDLVVSEYWKDLYLIETRNGKPVSEQKPKK